MYAMSKIWYNQVVKGNRKFSEVPKRYKEEVRQLLIENGHEDLIDDSNTTNEEESVEE